MSTIKVLQHALHDIQMGHIDECLPMPADLQEFADDWGIPPEHWPQMRLLGDKVESILEDIDGLEREVRGWLKVLEKEEP